MNKTIYSKLGKLVHDKIVEIRKEAGLTQRDLAKKLGREHSFVARVEQGERRVDFVELYVICEACDAKPREIIAGLVESFDKK